MIPLQTSEAEELARVLRWAEGQAPVRAVILESSYAVPDPPRDALTDDDVAFLVTDPETWQTPGDWVRALGEPLLRVRDVVAADGLPVQNDMLLFADSAGALRVRVAPPHPAAVRDVADWDRQQLDSAARLLWTPCARLDGRGTVGRLADL